MKDFEKLLESELEKIEQLDEMVNVKNVLSDIKGKVKKIFCAKDTTPHIVNKISNLFDMVVAGKQLFNAIQTKKLHSALEELTLRSDILEKTKSMVMSAVDDPKLRCDEEPAHIDVTKFKKEIDKIFKTHVDKISTKIEKLKKKLSKNNK